MEEPSLEGCWAKYGRAVKHLDALNDDIDRFVERKPNAIITKIDREASAYIGWLDVREEPDEFAWGLLVGDFVHNCRSALDQLVWQLVIANEQRPGTDNQFPIESRGERYWCRRKDGRPSVRDHRLRGVGDQHRTTIDALQPYRAGQYASIQPLSVLAWLSNTDKHQVIHTTLLAFEDPDPEKFRVNINEDLAEGFRTIRFRSGPLEHGAEIFRVDIKIIGPDPQVHMEGEPPVGIGFGERGIRREFLALIGDTIHAILQGVDQHVFGKTEPPHGRASEPR